jgi:hypothetical protein
MVAALNVIGWRGRLTSDSFALGSAKSAEQQGSRSRPVRHPNGTGIYASPWYRVRLVGDEGDVNGLHGASSPRLRKATSLRILRRDAGHL